MKARHKILADIQGGHTLTAQEKELLDRFHVDIIDGVLKALLVTGARPQVADPTDDELKQIETAVTKAGKELHHIHFSKYSGK